MEQMKEPEGNVHGNHQKLAMGEIDDLHDPEYQSQPNAGKGINAAEQNTGNQ
jgi:hypothetical protein